MSFPLLSTSTIAGLPWTAWLLWVAATGSGLAVVLVFYFKHRRSRRGLPLGGES
jgi:hypothetical protein